MAEDHVSVSMNTWKTELVLAVRSTPDDRLQRWLRDMLREEVLQVEKQASRFRDDSEVSAVNRGAGEWVQTSWEFVAVLTASLNAAAATDGLVDPLMGTQIVDAGYDVWAGQDSAVAGGSSDARWQDIEIQPGRSAAKVRIPAGSALDLGAITKGWLADRLAETVNRSCGLDVVANMGGDLRVISPGQPWAVAADPDLPGVPECAMELSDGGLATSGLGHRSWNDGHHIIDPRTGQPAATPWLSVSVLAAQAAGANTASTAALILAEEGPAWLAGMGLDGWFVADDGLEKCVGAWQDLRATADA